MKTVAAILAGSALARDDTTTLDNQAQIFWTVSDADAQCDFGIGLTLSTGLANLDGRWSLDVSGCTDPTLELDERSWHSCQKWNKQYADDYVISWDSADCGWTVSDGSAVVATSWDRSQGCTPLANAAAADTEAPDVTAATWYDVAAYADAGMGSFLTDVSCATQTQFTVTSGAYCQFGNYPSAYPHHPDYKALSYHHMCVETSSSADCDKVDPADGSQSEAFMATIDECWSLCDGYSECVSFEHHVAYDICYLNVAGTECNLQEHR